MHLVRFQIELGKGFAFALFFLHKEYGTKARSIIEFLKYNWLMVIIHSEYYFALSLFSALNKI